MAVEAALAVVVAGAREVGRPTVPSAVAEEEEAEVVAEAGSVAAAVGTRIYSRGRMHMRKPSTLLGGAPLGLTRPPTPPPSTPKRPPPPLIMSPPPPLLLGGPLGLTRCTCSMM